jgi:ATP-dependent helicase HrpB
VPLVLIDEPWTKNGKILVLEPRRLAARAAASRMAATLGEKVGDTVGLRVRFGSQVSAKTRIEVVTEGIFTRMLIDDPSLDGVAAVLFDEFHERSLDADLGLALARDAQQGLREDLRILVMSATLDGARVAKLLGDAPVVESQGRSFPIETRYLGRDARAQSSSRSRMRCCGLCGRTPARCWCSCRAPGKSAAPRRCCASASPILRSMSSRCMARSMPLRRIPRYRRPRRAAARSCWRPRSPRHR